VTWAPERRSDREPETPLQVKRGDTPSPGHGSRGILGPVLAPEFPAKEDSTISIIFAHQTRENFKVWKGPAKILAAQLFLSEEKGA